VGEGEGKGGVKIGGLRKEGVLDKIE